MDALNVDSPSRSEETKGRNGDVRAPASAAAARAGQGETPQVSAKRAAGGVSSARRGAARARRDPRAHRSGEKIGC